MSRSRVFAAAAIAATFNMGGAEAQSLSQGLVPAEFPPGSYTGRQYVDSEGCVFIRAGVDGNVTWVPRVTRSRKAICGFQPTFASPAPAAKPDTTEPAATAMVVAKAKPKSQEAKRVASTTVASGYVGSSGSAHASRQAKPEPKRYVPRHLYDSQMASRPAVKIPKGYKVAWDDDRLNPKRAHQTLAGKAQMDMIWTKTIPRKLITRKAEYR